MVNQFPQNAGQVIRQFHLEWKCSSNKLPDSFGPKSNRECWAKRLVWAIDYRSICRMLPRTSNGAARSMFQAFPTPPTDRFFEDYLVGATYICGSFTMAEDEITAFANLYDPQMMHVDRDLAAKGPFGGIIASGWHTVARAMRLVVDNFLPHNGLAAPGINELRWPQPVHPGDTLTLHATIHGGSAVAHQTRSWTNPHSAGVAKPKRRARHEHEADEFGSGAESGVIAAVFHS